MSMTFTQADLDSLKEALLTGAKSVQIGDRKFEYRDQADLLRLIQRVEQYLAGNSPSAESHKIIQAQFKKGYRE